MVTAMTTKLIKPSLAAAVVVLTPMVAFAHTGVGDTSGFVRGFGHPTSGLDHILAMLMVGVFAWQLGGRALWLLPIAFVSIMAVGGMLGIAGIEVPFVEIGIALSVVVLGAIVRLRSKRRPRRQWASSVCLQFFTVMLMEPKFRKLPAASPMLPAS